MCRRSLQPEQTLRERACLAVVMLTWLALALLLQTRACAQVLTDSGRPSSGQARWTTLADTLFQHLGREQGLPDQMVNAIAEDANGFIWIGMQNGLARWDGYRFRYFNSSKDPSSLAAPYVRILHKDKLGRLWIGTDGGGLNRYNDLDETFMRIPVGPDGTSHLGITAIVDDGMQGLWVGTKAGLDHFNLDGKLIEHVRSEKLRALTNDFVTCLLRARDGVLWVGSKKGLVRLRDGIPERFSLSVPGNVEPTIRTLTQTADGSIWVGTMGAGLHRISEKGLEVSRVRESDPNGTGLDTDDINFIQEVRPGYLWVGTATHGIIAYDVKLKLSKLIQHDPAIPSSFANVTGGVAFRDRAGMIWVGSQRGISRHDPNQHSLLTIMGGSSRKNSLADTDVTAIATMRDGAIWLGTQSKGLHIVNPQATSIKWFKPDILHPDTGLPAMTFHGFAETKGGDVLMATDRGLYHSTRDGSAFRRITLPPQNAASAVTSILLADQRLYLGSVDGLWEANLHQINLQKGLLPVTRVKGTQTLQNERIAYLLEGKGAALWIGTRNSGVFRLDRDSGQMRNLGGTDSIAKSDVPKRIASLMLDSKGRLWISTMGHGIYILTNPDAAAPPQFLRLRVDHGLPTDMVDHLIEDNQGMIWASTDAGIAVIDPNSFAIRSFQRADGSELLSFWVGIGAKTAHGEVLFGGLGGLMIVIPEKLKTWNYTPQLAITELQVGGKKLPYGQFNRDIQPNQVIEIKPEGNSLSVEFAALDLSMPLRNRYAYLLEGFDSEWQNVDVSKRLAMYTNLNPGNYRLLLRASNREGKWIEPDRVLQIRVLPAWYQTWWFLLICILALMAGIYFFVQLRTRYLQRIQAVLASQVAQRTAQLQEKQHALLESNQYLNESNAALHQANDNLNEAIQQLANSVETLRRLGDMGRNITANLDVETVFLSLFQAVDSLLESSGLGIYQLNAKRKSLELVFGRENGQLIPPHSYSLDSEFSNVARVARERKEFLLVADDDEVQQCYIPGTSRTRTGLFAPLIVDEELLGVMSIQTDQAHAYGERERLIFRTLCAYGAIALANAQTISALHQAQEHLVQQEKLASLGGLVAGIAHEINTPLGTALVAISGASTNWINLRNALITGRVSKSLLETNVEEGAEFTGLAMRTASRAAELISMFKTIAVRSDSDLIETQNLALYFHDLVTLIKTPLEQGGNRLELQVPDTIELHTVFEALTEALTRIFANTLDHAFTDGRCGLLRITVIEDEGTVIITVADNGHGITAENLPKVFDPFFTTKSGLHGHVGLGLHVAFNHVVQRLRGQIEIKSVQGQGTSVIIRLQSIHNLDQA